ncbi:MAG: hypothetical protein H7281_12285 [Bacteriovorax sp.]|nr:hypothetical protein [Bacteriovorax sp.]
MKRNVLVIAGLAVLSTSAHATKARVEALGQDSVRGSEYISDSRNIFRNPAVLNQTKNYLVTEWGTSVNGQNDSAAAPRAEGGFFREMGSFNYGVYLGNNEASKGRTGAVGIYMPQTNGLDLFLSGDMGLQWGARLHYANSKDEATSPTFEKKNTSFGLGLGAVMGEAEVYADLTLSDKSTGAVAAGDQFKTKPSFLVGGSYKWSGNTFFANYEGTKVEVTGNAGGATLGDTKTSAIVVGAGRIHEINPTARIITDASVKIGSTQTTAGKVKTNTLPVTLGFEADATSWLVLRGSVAQNVILNSSKSVTGKTTTNANSTGVNAGATLNFGKLKVDGTIGTTTAINGTSTTTPAGTNTGVLSLSNLMTRVGVSYWF